MKTKTVRIVVIAVSLYFSAGCTHLIDPYVKHTAVSDTTCDDDMSNALACVYKLQAEYLEAKSDQAEFQAWTGLVMIPLGAYAGGVAINDGHRTNITDLSLGMAGLYGMSTWLSRPQRSVIYSLGSDELQCAADALSPFEFVPKSTVEEQRDAVSADIGSLQLASNTLAERLTDSGINAVQTRALQNRQTLAAALITSATKEVDDANILLKKHNQAPGQLLGAARGINNAVNSALTSTVPSLDALPGTLNVVMDFYEGLSSSNMARISPPKDDIELQSEDAFDDDLAAFKTAFDSLTLSSGRLDNTLSTYTPDPPVAALETCNVDTQALEVPVSLNVTSLEFTGSEGAAQTVVISGGDRQYNYTSNAPGLVITLTPPSILTLRATAATEAGSYALVVQDFSGNRTSIPIIITAAPESPAEGGEDSPSGETCENQEGRLPPDQLNCEEE